MPRDHLEFIQAQSLPWQPDVLPYKGVRSKTLSQDPSSGARSCIARFPAAWILRSPFSLSCDEEFFVLQGSFEANGICYGKGDYAYFPAGLVRDGVKSETGCDVLSFFESDLFVIQPGELSADTEMEISRLPSGEMDWSAATDPNVASSLIGRKLLRPDTATGERTWLLKLETDDPYEINGVEQHPCVEEMFLLEGDIVMPAGVMTRGAYFWRPPFVPHGPTGSRQGFTALFRAKEGAFSTQWSGSDLPVAWHEETPALEAGPY